MPRGGKRPGAGRPKGSRSRSTLAKLVGGNLKLTVLDDGEFINLCRDQAPRLIQLLVKIANDPNVAGSARVGAATAVVNHAYGRPRLSVPPVDPANDDWCPLTLIRPGDDDFEINTIDKSEVTS